MNSAIWKAHYEVYPDMDKEGRWAFHIVYHQQPVGTHSHHIVTQHDRVTTRGFAKASTAERVAEFRHRLGLDEAYGTYHRYTAADLEAALSLLEE